MLRMLLLVAGLIAAASTLAAAQTAPAQTAPAAPAVSATPAGAPPLTAAQAQQMLDVLRDDAKRAQFLSVLEGLAETLPAAAVEPAPAAATAPVAKPPAAAATAPAAAAAHGAGKTPEKLIPLAPDSLGAQILVDASNKLSLLSTQVDDAARSLTDFPLFARWLVHVARDPDTRADMLDAAWKLALVLGAGLIVERLVRRLVAQPVHVLARRAPTPAEGATPGNAPDRPSGKPRLRPVVVLAVRRLPYMLGRLALDMLAVLAVPAVAYPLLSTPLGAPSTTRLVILAVVNAYVLCRAAVTVVRALVAPATPRLRLLPFGDEAALYVLVWFRRMAVTGIFGYAFAEVALLFGLYRVAHDTLIKLVVLSIHVALIVIVLQKRRAVAHWIRGREDAAGSFAVGRRLLAQRWHFIAIFYLVAMWLVWAFDVQDGFARILRISIATVVVVVVARLLIAGTHGALERWMRVDPALHERYPGLEQRLRRYHPVVRGVTTGLIAAVAAIVLFEAYGIDSLAWFEQGGLGGRLVSALVSIAVTLVVSLATWELANAAVQRRLAEVTREGRAARSARLLTLLPMLRTALLVAICLIAGLMVLSEIGVNIAPLLAGAGVVGIAIGFGSQKLVQDVITGLFLLLENAMQVGDVITLGGLSGTVEYLSVRTIRLRALDGSVYIIPFSAVTTVTNMTRDYAYALLDLPIGLNEQPDHVSDVVRDVVRTLREEPRWASAIRDDVEIMGVEKFVDLAYVLRARVMTLPGQRWAVSRELNRRVKMRFDELAIESPITSFRALSGNPVLVPAVRKPEEPAPG